MTAPNSQTRSLKERVAVGYIKTVSYLPLSVSRSLGVFVSFFAVHINSRFAQVTRKNIELCFPELTVQEREALSRKSMIETLKLGLEMPAVWLRDYQTWLKPRIKSVINRELLEEELAKGRGVILLAPHIGNWEIFGGYLVEVAPTMVLYQPPEMASVGVIIREARQKQGAAVVPTNSRGVASLLRFLKQGGLTGILPDQVPGIVSGEFAPFFHNQALTMTLVHSLRERTNCRLVTGYAKRVKGGFEVVFKSVDPDVYSDDALIALTAMNRTIEACVRDIPEQYQWEYKRFRAQPEGAPKIY